MASLGDSAGPSHCRLRHVVAIFYPCTYLLQNTNEELMLGSVKDSSDRYEPGPLIEDEDVIRHTDLREAGTTSFTSTTPAYAGTTDMWAPPGEPKGDLREGARLLHDLKLATSGHGGTQLSIVTSAQVEWSAQRHDSHLPAFDIETNVVSGAGQHCPVHYPDASFR